MLLELSTEKVEISQFYALNQKLGTNLPASLFELLKNNDGGYPNPNLFVYYDESFCERLKGYIGSFLCLIEKEYSLHNLPPFLPSGLVPFQEGVNYNFICFDYRRNVATEIPEIVDWNYRRNSGSLLSVYQNPPEFFPEGLIAFAEDGGGNLICFDYRKGKDNPNPPIVFWNHEADIGKDVSFIANSFDEFLSMLKSEDEIDALLNEGENTP